MSFNFTPGQWCYVRAISVLTLIVGGSGCAAPTTTREQRAELESLRSRDTHQQSLLAETQTKLRELAGETQELASERARLIGRLSGLANNDAKRAESVRSIETKIAGMEARLSRLLEETAFLRATQGRLTARQDLAVVPMDVLMAATRQRDAVPGAPPQPGARRNSNSCVTGNTGPYRRSSAAGAHRCRDDERRRSDRPRHHADNVDHATTRDEDERGNDPGHKPPRHRRW